MATIFFGLNELSEIYDMSFIHAVIQHSVCTTIVNPWGPSIPRTNQIKTLPPQVTWFDQ